MVMILQAQLDKSRYKQDTSRSCNYPQSFYDTGLIRTTFAVSFSLRYAAFWRAAVPGFRPTL